MRIPRVYVDAAIIPAEVLVLPSDVSHHLRNVLRRSEKDKIIVFNGKGGSFSL